MKKLFLATLVFVSLAMILISLSVEAAEQTKTEVLKTDQCLRVIGWTENCVTFKANTVVERPLNSANVVSGTLAKDACLKAQGWSVDATCAIFKAGSPIYFNKGGRVITGTLAKDSNLRPVGHSTARTYKGGHTITFDSLGHVLKESN